MADVPASASPEVRLAALYAFSDFNESRSHQNVELYGARETRVLRPASSSALDRPCLVVHVTDAPSHSESSRREYVFLVYNSSVLRCLALPYAAVRTDC